MDVRASTICKLVCTRRTAMARGYSILELMVVLMIAAIMTSIVVSNLKKLENPLKSSTAQFSSFLKDAKARAAARTVAYKVMPTSSTHIIAKYGATCSSATLTTDNTLVLNLPTGTYLTATNWSICFTSRGLTDQNLIVSLRDASTVRTVEIMLGGGVRVQ